MAILKQKLSHTISFLSLQILQKEAKTHTENLYFCAFCSVRLPLPRPTVLFWMPQWPSFCRKKQKNYSLQFCFCICLTVKWTPIHCLRQFLGPGNYFSDLLPHSFVDNVRIYVGTQNQTKCFELEQWFKLVFPKEEMHLTRNIFIFISLSTYRKRFSYSGRRLCVLNFLQ